VKTKSAYNAPSELNFQSGTSIATWRTSFAWNNEP